MFYIKGSTDKHRILPYSTLKMKKYLCIPIIFWTFYLNGTLNRSFLNYLNSLSKSAEKPLYWKAKYKKG